MPRYVRAPSTRPTKYDDMRAISAPPASSERTGPELEGVLEHPFHCFERNLVVSQTMTTDGLTPNAAWAALPLAEQQSFASALAARCVAIANVAPDACVFDADARALVVSPAPGAPPRVVPLADLRARHALCGDDAGARAALEEHAVRTFVLAESKLPAAWADARPVLAPALWSAAKLVERAARVGGPVPHLSLIHI